MLPLRPVTSVVWNLFLAVVPVVLAFVMNWGLRGRKDSPPTPKFGGARSSPAPPELGAGGASSRGHGGSKLWLLLLPLWLAFLPNTCYLLTEWRHFLETVAQSGPLLTGAPPRDRVLDLLVLTGFYGFYSGAGLLCFFLAVWPLDRLARRRLGKWAWACQAAVFILCGLGVYLGLVSRFNTWDILHPTRSAWLTQTIAETVTRPTVMALIGGFSLTLWILYTVFDLAMDGALLRLRRPAAPANVTEPVTQEHWHHALK